MDGIRTKGPKGTILPTRLHAQWLFFLDKANLSWEIDTETEEIRLQVKEKSLRLLVLQDPEERNIRKFCETYKQLNVLDVGARLYGMDNMVILGYIYTGEKTQAVCMDNKCEISIADSQTSRNNVDIAIRLLWNTAQNDAMYRHPNQTVLSEQACESTAKMSPVSTIGPHGILFRSKLESRWAFMFEGLGWKWTYEPPELDTELIGYIPDFLVQLGDHIELLVEIKAETERDNKSIHVQKARKSGWRGMVLLIIGPLKVEETGCVEIGSIYDNDSIMPLYVHTEKDTIYWTIDNSHKCTESQKEIFNDIWKFLY